MFPFPVPFDVKPVPFVVKPVFPGGGGNGSSSRDSAGGPAAYMSMLFDLLLRTEVENPYLMSLPWLRRFVESTTS